MYFHCMYESDLLYHLTLPSVPNASVKSTICLFVYTFCTYLASFVSVCGIVYLFICHWSIAVFICGHCPDVSES